MRPRGPYTPDEAGAIGDWVRQRDSELGQALAFIVCTQKVSAASSTAQRAHPERNTVKSKDARRSAQNAADENCLTDFACTPFILSSGARIDETLHLRSDKIFIEEARVELQGKGGRVRKIQVLHPKVLKTLDLSRRFVYLTEQPGRLWKDAFKRRVRQACDVLDIRRRGVHGFRATAACEFVDIRGVMGCTEMAARQELAMWLGHNPHRTEVTYAYVPRNS